MSDETKQDEQKKAAESAEQKKAAAAKKEADEKAAADESSDDDESAGAEPTPEVPLSDDGTVDRAALDGNDVGVPMLPGSADEPAGPEDALGSGDKRGDYAEVMDGRPHAESVATEDGGEPIRDEDGNIVDLKPRSKMVDQTSRVEEVGDAEGLKGGVETSAAE